LSAIIKKKDGSIEFKSEMELENFVFIHLDRLLNLSPVARQYRIGTEICDVLATDSKKRLSIIELKNSEDRYIVQQLTRYYHGLIESKPKLDGIDYRKPVKLIAIVPSFHAHNFVDRIYTKLDFDFFTFDLSVDRSTGNIFFELTNFHTKEKSVEQIPQIKRNNLIKAQETMKIEVDYNEMIDYYMRLSYSSKLGLDSLSPEQLREYSEKYKSNCTKEFKMNLEFMKKTGTTQKSVTVKLPAKVKIVDLYQWCWKNVTGGTEGRGAKLRQVHRTRSGVFKIRIWLYDIYK
jgi:Endonuclease NucS